MWVEEKVRSDVEPAAIQQSFKDKCKLILFNLVSWQERPADPLISYIDSFLKQQLWLAATVKENDN